MPAPNSSVNICNMALDAIGQKPIASITSPTSSSEEIMARWYDETRRTVLREYIWNFAQKYTTLARTGDGVNGFADAFLLPNDCLRLNSIGESRYTPDMDYEILNGREVHTNTGDSLLIWYTADVVDVGKMDPLFIGILSKRLALNVAYAFTKKKSVVEIVSGLLAVDIMKAISVDGQERPPRRIQRSKYLTARRIGGSIGRDNRYYDF